MVVLWRLTAALVLAAQSAAAPLSLPVVGNVTLPLLGSLNLKELVQQPLGFLEHGAAPADTPLRMQIALKHKDLSGLEQKLLDLSNPSSANYGKYLSKDELDALTQPVDGSADKVMQWLSSAGIDSSIIERPSPDWIELELPVSQAESLLAAKYSLFQSQKGGSLFPRALQYSLPEELHALVDTVQPTTAFFHPQGPQPGSDATESAAQLQKRQRQLCGDTVTPDCVKAMYNVDYTPTTSGSGVGVVGINQTPASHSDAQQYFAKYVPSLTDFADLDLNGGSNSGQPSFEGNLDVQVAGSMSAPVPITYINIGGTRVFNDQLLNLTSYLNTDPNPITSVSISYSNQEQYNTADYAARVCDEFMKAGARGVSILVASGDNGVQYGLGNDCDAGPFEPQWPNTCPYVTSVGATMPLDGQEVAANFTALGSSGATASGGGFSNRYPIPDYQASAVQSYVASLNGEYNGRFNASGRAYPDLSLIGSWDIVYGGLERSAVGTSISAPAVAGMVASLNEYRASKGQGPLGFLNPLIYAQASAAFNDITSGSNPGCGTDGFNATAGWDPLTGVGSLDYAKLRALI